MQFLIYFSKCLLKVRDYPEDRQGTPDGVERWSSAQSRHASKGGTVLNAPLTKSA